MICWAGHRIVKPEDAGGRSPMPCSRKKAEIAMRGTIALIRARSEPVHFTGRNGGRVKALADYCVVASGEDTSNIQ
jgi:hypothetical protein